MGHDHAEFKGNKNKRRGRRECGKQRVEIGSGGWGREEKMGREEGEGKIEGKEEERQRMQWAERGTEMSRYEKSAGKAVKRE